MLSMETNLHLHIRLAGAGIDVNDLAVWAASARNEIVQEVLAQALWELQDKHFTEVQAGRSELVCPRCGVVHQSGKSVVKRGQRKRQVRTSSGTVRFFLLQVTCLDCGATRTPYSEALGLAARQRVCEELLNLLCEGVTKLSYRKTTDLAKQWMGANVSPRRLHREVQERGKAIEFTEGPDFKVMVADSTRVPAGELERGEEACIALQLQGTTTRAGRPCTQKRVVGVGVGMGAWEEALATATEPQLIITDGQQGLHTLVAEAYPGVRHQQCEWHVTHSLKHMLALDGMGVVERKEWAKKLSALINQAGPKAREQYKRFAARLQGYHRVHTLLRNATDYILYREPSEVRTSSHAEREMREINRRTDVGVRWSVPGVTNMLRLHLAQRHNADDYHRVWSPPRPITWSLASML